MGKKNAVHPSSSDTVDVDDALSAEEYEAEMAGIGSKMTEKDRRKYHQKRKEHHVFGQAALGTMENQLSEDAPIGDDGIRHMSALRRRGEANMSAKIGAPGSPGDSSSGNRLTRRYNNRKNLTGWALRRERARRYIKNVWEYWTEVPIWKQPIKHIEGEFGAGVASFFVFLKSLFLMNLAMLVLTTSFIILPMAVQWHQPLDCRDATLAANVAAGNVPCETGFDFANLLDGGGRMGYTAVFIGGYSVKGIGDYRIDLAYTLVVLLIFLACLRHLFVKIFGSGDFKAAVVIDNEHPITAAVLGSWDYSLGSAAAVAFSNKTFNAVLKILLEKKARAEVDSVKRVPFRWMIGLGWIWFSGCMAAVIIGILELVEYDSNAGNDGIGPFVFPIGVTLINALAPTVVNLSVKYEGYIEPNNETKVMLSRMWMLKMIALFSSIFGIRDQVGTTSSPAPALSAGTLDADPVLQELCAGTRIGQAMYKLLMMDALVSVPIEWATYSYAHWRAGKDIDDNPVRTDFRVPQGIINHCYRQAFVWFGLPFCPLIPLFGMLAGALFFYLDSYIIRKKCKPPAKRSAEMQSVFFLKILCLTFVCAVVPLLLVLREWNPNCGPYASMTYSTFFDGLYVWMLNDTTGVSEDSTTGRFIRTIGDTLFLWCMILIMILWNYIKKQDVKDKKKDMEDLRKQIEVLSKRLTGAAPGGGGAALGSTAQNVPNPKKSPRKPAAIHEDVSGGSGSGSDTD